MKFILKKYIIYIYNIFRVKAPLIEKRTERFSRFLVTIYKIQRPRSPLLSSCFCLLVSALFPSFCLRRLAKASTDISVFFWPLFSVIPLVIFLFSGFSFDKMKPSLSLVFLILFFSSFFHSLLA